MMKKFCVFVFLIGGAALAAQSPLFTAGVSYTSGAPTYNPGRTGSRLVIDTSTWYRWEHVAAGTWTQSGVLWSEHSGCSAPSGAPTKHQTIYRTNTCTPPKMYKWTGSAWVEMGAATGGGGGTVTSVNLTAGAGISVSGGPVTTSGSITVTNTGDLSSTNELQTLSLSTEDILTITPAGNSVDLTRYVKKITPFGGDVSGTYDNVQIVAGAVGTAELANAAVTGAKIASGTITAGNIASNTITGTQISNGTITSADLANNSVTSAAILDGTILGDDVATDAIGPTQLEATAVTAGTYTTGPAQPLSITVDADGRITDATATTLTNSTYSASVSTFWVWDATHKKVTADPTANDLTVELNGAMIEDFPYRLIGGNNATNDIFLTTSGSPYFMKISGDYGATATSYTLTAGQHLTIRRDGNTFEVDKN